MFGHTCFTAVVCEADFDTCLVAFVCFCIFLHVRVRGHLLYPAFSHLPNPHSGLSVCLRRQRVAGGKGGGSTSVHVRVCGVVRDTGLFRCVICAYLCLSVRSSDS